MNSQPPPQRELQAARNYYSYAGVGLVAVGALLGLAAGSFVIGGAAMILGAVAAALGTLAPESVCLAVARADQPFQDFLRRDDQDDDF